MISPQCTPYVGTCTSTLVHGGNKNHHHFTEGTFINLHDPMLEYLNKTQPIYSGQIKGTSHNLAPPKLERVFGREIRVNLGCWNIAILAQAKRSLKNEKFSVTFWMWHAHSFPLPRATRWPPTSSETLHPQFVPAIFQFLPIWQDLPSTSTAVPQATHCDRSKSHEQKKLLFG